MPAFVLIVDDDPLILDLAAGMLEELGCRVVTTPSAGGPSAFSRNSRKSPPCSRMCRCREPMGSSLSRKRDASAAICVLSSHRARNALMAGLSCANHSIARTYHGWCTAARPSDACLYSCKPPSAKRRPALSLLTASPHANEQVFPTSEPSVLTLLDLPGGAFSWPARGNLPRSGDTQRRFS